ncbi:polypeptide N-acetylgalactosaminyltransferase 8 [Scaptodrosophila lebanonensis]|uniref:Polypeptide N-acetylgalactosaminyltransferase 8 n=1 Tax=Drosophila lebanonensis TaxID=7225 RepID=A0A6J2T9Y8_DROLE|nr:polypeptide N-acetylgalactosaminyltransferase 8 [Scaptodrosophila lebanonensis]
MFGYNVWLSERTCLDRRLPDVRHQFCNKHKWMDVELPRASIILTYHQVDISAILRALHSIRERTPMELIREIILIDDATEVEELRSRDFLVLVNKLFGVFLRVRRLKEHVGVWAARKVGAEMAHGDVLVFMEPYIEVNVDWLPPLLLPLTKNWRVSTMPVLDIIDHATLRYAAGEPKRLAFDWHLHRMVLPLRAKEQEKYPEPHGSPVLNGKVFAITSAWFWEIDSYQTEYYNPPAVELELSFKIWQCGGRVLQASCSRVGYIKHKSNTLNKESMELEDFMDEQVSFRNLVEVWFDEYKQVVYETWPNLQHFKPDNLRMEFILRRRLQCRSARNFFEHVAPDIMAAHPFELPEDLANGELAMINEPKLCLSTEPRNRSISLRLRPCKRRSFQQRIGSAQYWAIGSDRSLKQKQIWLLLLLAVLISLIYYINEIKPENLAAKTRAAHTTTITTTTTTTTKTTAAAEHNIRYLRANYEALVVPSLGAMGKPALAEWSADELLAIESSQNETGYNAWLSNRISVERKLHDMRHRRCKKLRYRLKQLPPVSVVITYHNEQPSVLLRTLHSLKNRTPKRLLREIILVNDASDAKELSGSDFANYVSWKFPELVQHLQLPKQLGLMGARVEGARQAQADVLVFLDAHIEATRGWLPPLLAPLLENNRTCTTPIIDTIDYANFAYRRGKPSRGFFNWHFNYVQLPLLPAEAALLPAPHDNPIMNGGLFAIRKQWFFELGAYDEGLRVWGGEQFELSLKLWLCGGRILEVPCARVGHLFRHGDYQVRYTQRNNERKAIERNYKRIAEVWLDEYKDKLYANVPSLTYARAGPLKTQRALRERLQCKPFKWFLQHLASDFLAVYPLEDPADFAVGALQSLAAPELCLDTAHKKSGQPQLLPCGTDLKYPELNQKWTLSYRRELRSSYLCLELRNRQPNATIWLWQCHGQLGNQFWYYDPKGKQLVQGVEEAQQRCLEAQVEQRIVVANICDAESVGQRWNFGFVNQTALQKFWVGITRQ